MDKKNTIIGVALLILGFALLFNQQPEPPQRPDATEPARTQPAEGAEERTATASGERRPSGPTGGISLGDFAETPATQVDREEEINPVLENEFIRVVFTNWGGAIRGVALKKYPLEIDGTEPYVLNAHSEIPALNLKVDDGGNVLEFDSSFEVIQEDSNTISFVRELAPGVRMERRYRIAQVQPDEPGPDPYLIIHQTRIINEREEGFALRNILIGTGTAEPAEADPYGWYLNFGYSDGNSATFHGLKAFNASSIPFFSRPARDVIRESQPVRWASVKNQFFTGVLTAQTPASGYITQPVTLTSRTANGVLNRGVTGSMIFEGRTIPSGSTHEIDLHYYAGPKEYPRLSKLDHREDLVMQFGWFGMISKVLLHLLTAFESLVKNYGVAIIMVTIVIRLLLWPLTAKAAKSSKRMAKIQEPLKEIREKYKGDPERLNKETLKLFKENRINPAAGCLPLLIQIPILFGFFYMLRTASELRFAPFFGWINDLSQPEMIFDIAGFPIRVLPLLMGISMFFVMRMTPTTLDSMQRKIFAIMPVIVTIFCYNFSSGLVLYWTTSNIISIIQQRITNNMKDEELDKPAVVEAPPAGKKKKNKPKRS